MIFTRSDRQGFLVVLVLVGTLSCGSDSTTGPDSGTGSGPLGRIEVTAATTGVNLDPDGYAVLLQPGEAGSPIGANATVVISNLVPGEYEVRLSGLAANCQWTPSPNASKSATVTAGTTTRVTFDVTCVSASLGTIRVRASTTGSPPGPPFPFYFVGIDTREVGVVPVDGASAFRVEAGRHTVSLDAGHCLVGGNYRTVEVVPGGAVEAAFNVTCQ